FQRASGHPAEALQALKAIPKESKHYVDALFERSLAAQSAGKQDEAARCVREILQDYPGSFAANCLQAEMAANYDDAIARWRMATALRTDSDFAFAHLGATLARAGRFDESKEACRKALEIDPDNVLAKQVLEQIAKR